MASKGERARIVGYVERVGADWRGADVVCGVSGENRNNRRPCPARVRPVHAIPERDIRNDGWRKRGVVVDIVRDSSALTIRIETGVINVLVLDEFARAGARLPRSKPQGNRDRLLDCTRRNRPERRR